MTTEPHPSDVALFAFAAGTPDETERVETATHVRGCASCGAFVPAMEHVGGIVLDDLPPTALADGSLTDVMARIDKLVPPSGPPKLDDNSVLLLHAGRRTRSCQRPCVCDAEPLRAAIAALPTPYRDTLVLRDIEGLDYREIAKVTEAPIGTVMSRLARARHRLITAIQKQ